MHTESQMMSDIEDESSKRIFKIKFGHIKDFLCPFGRSPKLEEIATDDDVMPLMIDPFYKEENNNHRELYVRVRFQGLNQKGTAINSTKFWLINASELPAGMIIHCIYVNNTVDLHVDRGTS